MKKIYIILGSIITVFFIGCASQVSPGGGPVDTTPPELLSTTPEENATNVARDIVFEALFDERIKVEANHIFISPPYPKFNFSHRGARFNLRPDGELLDNTTYVITISTNLADLRGNNLRAARQIAFSTGDELDSLSVSGRVLNKNIDPSRYTPCILWRLPFDSLRVPDYITWTDSSGFFKIDFLPDDDFILAAFERLDGDNMPVVHGQYCVFSDTIRTKSGNNSDLLMIMAEHDTAGLYVRMASQRDDHSIEFTLSAIVGITPDFDVSSKPPVGEFMVLPGYGRYDKFRLFFEKPLQAGQYIISLKNLVSRTRVDIDSIVVNIREDFDTLPPRVAERTPRRSHSRTDEDVYKALLSNPIKRGAIIAEAFKFDTLETDTTSQTVVDTSFVSIPGRSVIANPYILEFHPDFGNIDFQVTNVRWQIADALGYNDREYSDTAWTHFTYRDDDIFGSIIVKIDGDPCENLIMMLKGTRGDMVLKPTDSGYVASSLIEGLYKIWAFCDEDGDSTYFSGNIIELEHAERTYFLGDSIAVKSRWTTEINW